MCHFVEKPFSHVPAGSLEQFTPRPHAMEIMCWAHYKSWNLNRAGTCLHELSHVYNACIGTGHSLVKSLYDSAKISARYSLVDHCDGKRLRAYGLNNHLEMFASLSVALFGGRNDYQPFTRADLELFDPISFIMLLDIWSLKGDVAVGGISARKIKQLKVLLTKAHAKCTEIVRVSKIQISDQRRAKIVRDHIRDHRKALAEAGGVVGQLKQGAKQITGAKGDGSKGSNSGYSKGNRAITMTNRHQQNSAASIKNANNRNKTKPTVKSNVVQKEKSASSSTSWSSFSSMASSTEQKRKANLPSTEQNPKPKLNLNLVDKATEVMPASECAEKEVQTPIATAAYEPPSFADKQIQTPNTFLPVEEKIYNLFESSGSNL